MGFLVHIMMKILYFYINNTLSKTLPPYYSFKVPTTGHVFHKSLY